MVATVSSPIDPKPQDWESLFTVSSVPSTVWGPGTVAGRAIMALGEATLKGFERVIDLESLAIQRRLRTIRRQIPVLTAEMYHDLMELARPDLYPSSILTASLNLICLQITYGYSTAIVGALSHLPLSEIGIILLQLMVMSVGFDPEAHAQSIAPNQIISDEKQMLRAVWCPDNILDVLATLVQIRAETAWVCYDVIDDLSLCPFFCILFLKRRDHAILRMRGEESLNIPIICRTPLAKMQGSERWKNWLLLEDQPGLSAESRFRELSVLLTNVAAKQSVFNPEFFDAAVDLFEILRYTKSPKLRPVAREFLIRFLSSAKPVVWDALKEALDFTLMRDPLRRPKPLALRTIYGDTVYVAVQHAGETAASSPTSPDFEPILCEFMRYVEEKNEL
ncbi:hypothetical protein R3P38DRAFT_2857404 [Favolaschia claudopus]|uniref:Transcription factor domain-containing protein n=1 Tax=Favolaschia claudopus TaxID=2862362 RepID=A0AAW0DIF5_9AGAR